MKVIVVYYPRRHPSWNGHGNRSPLPSRASSQRLMRMPRLAISLLLICLMPLLLSPYGRSQDNSSSSDSPPIPLTLSELRTINGQLFELQVRRAEVTQLRSHLDEELAAYEKEKALWAERIEVERKAFELSQVKISTTEKERDLNIQEVQFYKNALKACQNAPKRGFWCKFKRFWSAGIAKCR